jgi:hypothetical protein
LLSVPTANALPEVLDNLVVLGVATVIGVLLPVIDIDISNTTDEQFQLTFIKNVYEIRRNEFMETGDECLELLLDTFLNAPFSDEPNQLARFWKEQK